jgi:hypothetical protein
MTMVARIMKRLRAGNGAFSQDHVPAGKCVRGAFAEQQALASRGEDYRAYQRSTSAFVPWFPKKEVS